MTNNKTGETTDQRSQALGFEADEFQRLIDDVNIPDEQKREFLKTLWNIVVTFVDLGFGMEATQQAMRPLIDIPPDPKSFKTRPEVKRLLEASFDDASGAQSEKETSRKETLYEIQ